MERWKGKIALVTGASVGIGAALCRALVGNGMIVVGCARRLESIQSIAQETAASSGKLIPMKCDVRKESDILAVFEEIRRTLGRLDVCINNAGLANYSPLLTGDAESWTEMLDVNVLALCICTREAVKLMQETGVDNGQIIHIGSMAGHRLPTGGSYFYSGTKFMVTALTEGLRRELKALNSHIRISSVSPGIVETEFLTNLYKNDPSGKRPQDLYASLQGLQGQDVAETVLYILSTPPHVEVHDVLVRPVQQAF